MTPGLQVIQSLLASLANNFPETNDSHPSSNLEPGSLLIFCPQMFNSTFFLFSRISPPTLPSVIALAGETPMMVSSPCDQRGRESDTELRFYHGPDMEQHLPPQNQLLRLVPDAQQNPHRN
ncbi:hypothetical protein AAC387_Pa08g1161 [Persea americana]